MTTPAAMTAFRYLYLYDNTAGAAATRPVIGWWDYASSLTLNNGDSLTVKFNNANLIIDDFYLYVGTRTFSSADFKTDTVGNPRIKESPSTANGFHTAWVGGFGDIDEQLANTTDFITSSVVGNKSSFTGSWLAASTTIVYGVNHSAYIKQDGSTQISPFVALHS